MRRRKQMDKRLEEIKARAEAATPGPWMWDIRHKNRIMQLTTTHSGRYYIMDFVRWGLQDACPRFQVYEKYSGPVTERKSHGMERADKMVKPLPGREHHFGYEDKIEHPDAVFIEHSKEDVDFLLAHIAALTAALEAAEKRAEAAEADLDALARDNVDACDLCDDYGKCGRPASCPSNKHRNFKWRGPADTKGGQGDEG
jgi:hypothetical protein